MPNDLYYFYESDLNKSNFTGFYNSLPSPGLKEQFLNSVPNKKVRWAKGWVLQGYKGPNPNNESGDSEKLSPSGGLQEVRYWWDMTKHINWVPVLGTVVWVASMVAGEITEMNKWCSLYFDSKTGECLSHDKEVAASKLNGIGRQLFNSGKFIEAKEYFSNAYTHSNNKANYDVYKENENKAQAEVDKNNQADLLDREGNELHGQGKYEKAYDKFDQAYNKCTSGYSEKARFKSNRDIAKNNWAEELNKQGNTLWEQNNYSEAREKYNQAYHKCTTGYKNAQAFKNSSDKAQVEVDKNNQADLLNREGDELHRQAKYEKAYEKFVQAYQKCTSGYSEEATFKSNRDIAKNDWAEELNKEGNKLWEQNNYSEAVEKYNQAYQKCTSGYHNALAFNNNKDKAQAEVDAINLNSQGDTLFRQGKYSEAETKYQEAYVKSQVEMEYTKYSVNRENTKTEIDAIGLKELGDKEFREGRYDSAKVKYQQACDKSSVPSNKLIYTTCINKTKIEIYNSVLMDFRLLLIHDITDSKLTEFAYRLDKMINEGYGRDSEIVNRYHIISLRIASKKMKSQLESINQEDMSDLIEAIMNLIETEIEVLQTLNITDQKLEQELRSFEEKLRALDLDDECEERNNDDKLVDITTIASRVKEIDEEVDNRVLEKLGQYTQLEYGGNA